MIKYSSIQLEDIDEVAHQKSAASTAATLWGSSIKGGFVQIPNALIRHQAELGLQSTELAVILNLLMHWWFLDRQPFPQTSVIAKRIGVDQRTVQRILASLEQRGFIQKMPKTNYGSTKNVKPYNLQGLVNKLEHFLEKDPEFQKKKHQIVDYEEKPLQSSTLEVRRVLP